MCIEWAFIFMKDSATDYTNKIIAAGVVLPQLVSRHFALDSHNTRSHRKISRGNKTWLLLMIRDKSKQLSRNTTNSNNMVYTFSIKEDWWACCLSCAAMDELNCFFLSEIMLA
jgi:hypothetical protein